MKNIFFIKTLEKIQYLCLIFVFSLFLMPLSKAQESDGLLAPGSWVGEIAWAGNNFRLVFHIETKPDGTLTGTLDSPDKSVKDIPISRVLLDKDAVLFEISSAQASYEGKIIKGKNTIKGIWREGALVLPLILTHTVESIKPRGFEVKAHGAVMGRQKTSPHFDFYSTVNDQDMLGKIASVLEDSYARVTSNLNVIFTDKIRVYIYPDLKSFHLGIFLEEGPDWLVAAAGRKELKMVSPLNPGGAHTYDSVMQAIVHELVHTAVMKMREGHGMAEVPKWLNEGYAFYEAQQMADQMRAIVISKYSKKQPPKWSELDVAAVEFGEMGGYIISATIIEFLVNIHGRDKLIKLINQPENITEIYGESIEDLENSWVEYFRNVN